MKRLSVVLGIVGVVLLGCSHAEQIELDAPTKLVKPNDGRHLSGHSNQTFFDMSAELVGQVNVDISAELAGQIDVDVLTKAVKNAVKVPGIVNMANPQYKFSLGDQVYRLWIDDVSGVIMNTEDTTTIYSLTETSLIEVKELVENNETYWIYRDR